MMDSEKPVADSEDGLSGPVHEWDEGFRLYPEEFAARYREAGYWTDDTFAQFIDRSAELWPDREAVVGKNYAGELARWTYGQVRDRAAHVSAVLARHGVGTRDRVLVQLPNIADYVPVIFGIFRMGAIPQFSIPAHREEALASFIDKARPTVAITVEKHAGCNHRELFQRTLQRTEHRPEVLVLGEELCPASVAAPETAPAEVDPEALAFIQVSGGSTGVPKLIPRSHAAYHYTIRESAAICGVDRDTRMLAVLPAAHNFTMSSPGILGVLWAGGAVVMCPDPVPSTAFELIEAEKITMVSLVPPLLMSWLAAYPRSTKDISSLELMQVGGAACPTEAAKRVRPELGCQIQQVFGMAEGLVNYTRLDDPEELQVSTQGLRISPADEVRVMGEDGQPVEPGEPGVLWTRGPYTIRGYIGGASADSFSPDGFYTPGDVVRELPSGHLVVSGRVKDHINRAGEKISAEELENYLVAFPGIIDAAVVGVPDDRLGERTCAFIIVKDSATITHADVTRFLRERGVEPFKIPDQSVITESFPVTGVGKLSRMELRRILANTVK